MAGSQDPSSRTGRRQFLGKLSAGVAAGVALAKSGKAGAAAGAKPSAMPTMTLGKHRISRLVAGHNPIGGYSYLGHHMDQHMRRYFTVERTVKFLQDCEREGINAHQFSFSDKMTKVLPKLREAGTKMQFICLHSDRKAVKSAVASLRPIAMAHHGGVTDRLFAEG